MIYRLSPGDTAPNQLGEGASRDDHADSVERRLGSYSTNFLMSGYSRDMSDKSTALTLDWSSQDFMETL
jgi:hypothetical protein